MRSETVILIKIEHKIERHCFDFSWTLSLIQTKYALILSDHKEGEVIS